MHGRTSRVARTPVRSAALSSARHAAERAIDRTKGDKTSTWESLAVSVAPILPRPDGDTVKRGAVR